MENTHTHEQIRIPLADFGRLQDAGYPVEERAGVPTVQVPPAVFRAERRRAHNATKAARKRAAASRAAQRRDMSIH